MSIQRDPHDSTFQDFNYSESESDITNRKNVRKKLEERLELKRLKEEFRDEFDDDTDTEFDWNYINK